MKCTDEKKFCLLLGDEFNNKDKDKDKMLKCTICNKSALSSLCGRITTSTLTCVFYVCVLNGSLQIKILSFYSSDVHQINREEKPNGFTYKKSVTFFP